MAKKREPRTAAPAREQTVHLKLSGQEYQLIAYAAAKSNIRGINVWMRTKLVDAAKEKLSDKVAADILDGRATLSLLKESLAASRKPDTPAEVIPINTGRRMKNALAKKRT